MNIRISGRGRRAPGCFGCLVPLAGLLFLTIGIYLTVGTLQFLPGTLTAQGTIIHCSYDDPSGGVTNTCGPTVRFTTASGQSITINASFGSSSFHEGQTVQIRYHKNTPYDGRIDSPMATWLLPLIAIGAGILILIFALRMLLRGALFLGLGYFSRNP
jgi:hypothetical protein